ncbi:MAG: phenylalanine--tRNA ligase subunit beta [Chitinispirillaceae bacterium]|nr:phenylalanine--tRNA ligase subunit beta [Chitinispirillaceae bacterium]
MKIVYSWLKDFIDTDLPVERLADALTSSGLEVASIDRRHAPEGVVIARVLETAKHPNADRLSVCKVDAGTETPLTVVCGAPNVAAGMHAPLATVGTVFGPEFTVKKSKIRGVESSGMLCSEKELGISDDHGGLMNLPADMVPGRPFSDYFPPDVVIEIELTPDRGDCLSMLGVAREVAARFGLPLKQTAKRPQENRGDPVDKAISVVIEAPERCPRYMGRLVRGVTIKPSPQWLRNRLSLAGMRPINNAVDVTNYMLLHFGQPMHAFDHARLRGRAIRVKTAGEAQGFMTLDNIERPLLADDLLIADGSRPVALAGIMGGAGSEITDATTDVFLECAFFEQTGIRKTAKRLGISTDSSYRFERGVDPGEGLVDALDTAAAMLSELAGGVVAQGTIDVYPEKRTQRTIILHPEKVARVLGVAVANDRITSFLQSLQISCPARRDGTIACTVPLFRHDLAIEEDLIEEIGRLYGYDNIPASVVTLLPLNRALPDVERTIDAVRHALAFSGLREAVTNSLTSRKKWLLVTPEKAAVPLLNPLTPDMALMRTTLVNSLLDITAYNCNRNNRNNRFFEIGKVFDLLPSGDPRERDVVALLIEGDFVHATWNNSAQPVSFYMMKGILEAFSGHLGFTRCSFCGTDEKPRYFGKEAAAVGIGEVVCGYAGMIEPEIADVFEIKTPVCYAELDITGLLATFLPVRSYKPLPRFPALERDFCFVMDEAISASDITGTISSISPLIEEVYPFDVFRGEKLGDGKKSIAFNTRFRSSEKTLSDTDVEKLCGRIVSTVAKTYKAQLRT